MKKKILFALNILIFNYLFCFPIKDFNYHLPNTNLSPYSAGLGGICLTNADNHFALYDNPALLSDVKAMTFSSSFCLPDKNQSFTDIMKTNPLMQKSVFRGLAIQAHHVGFIYHELANDHFTKSDSLNKIYQDYKLRSIGISFADTSGGTISWGLSIKYLDGRLVYLKENKRSVTDSSRVKTSQKLASFDTNYIIEDFIDSKSMGYASDLGIYGKKSGFYYGFVVHDLYSKLYWTNHPDKKLPTRGSFSAELRGQNVSYISSVTSLWNIHETPLYCQSLNYSSNLGNPNYSQSLAIRFGATSPNYKKSENILFGFGTSYMIQTFKIDLSMQTQGLKTNTAQYMFSLSFGE